MAQRQLTAPTKKPIRLTPVRPNLGLTIRYQAQIDALLDAMNRDVVRSIRAQWRRKPPELAEDISPAAALRALFRGLVRKWSARFADFAETIGGSFGRKTAAMTDHTMSAALKKAGFTVKFTMTKTVNDVMQATIAEQVGLIKSIPAQYLLDVQGAVMRSVQVGGDLGPLTAEIEQKYGISRRRAATIARDQNMKATASITRVRQVELGITQAIWAHSRGGRVPRPTHLANNGKCYDVAKGWFDPHEGKNIWPGQLINCFPGDMPVLREKGTSALWRTYFNGPMVHIRIGSDLLKGTLNHPILTRRGWIAMGDLHNSDEIVCMAHQGRDMINDNEHKPVTTFSELFESLAIVHGYVSRDGVAFDFHGDHPNSHVDEIIILNDCLNIHGQASRTQNVRDLSLPWPDGMINLAVSRVAKQVLHPHTSGARDVLLADLGGFTLGSSDIGLGSSATKPISDQYTSDITGRVAREVEGGGYGGASHTSPVHTNNLGSESVPITPLIDSEPHRAELFAQFIRIMSDSQGGLFEFDARPYELRRMSDKTIRDFSGHVFTMQTLTGYYSVGDALVQAKNCRCLSLPIISGLSG